VLTNSFVEDVSLPLDRMFLPLRDTAWALVFGSMWQGFSTRFDTILKDLAYHGELLDKEAATADISNAVTHHDQEIRKWEQQEQEWTAVKIHTVLTWLGEDEHPPADILEEHSRDCHASSCEWFIQHKRTQLWLGNNAQSTLLWLHGKPGAGQSPCL
jgi:hypothetical protein